MYSSALSQPGEELAEGDKLESVDMAELQSPIAADANDMLCASQTLDAVPLTPVIVVAPRPLVKSCTEIQEQVEDAAEEQEKSNPAESGDKEKDSEPNQPDPENPTASAKSETEDLRANSITGGLVKGALSVAASAYKALFTGQTGSEKLPEDAASHDAMMAVLVEMGFGDRALNQRLLQKHNRNLLDVVNELVQMTDNNWYTTRY